MKQPIVVLMLAVTAIAFAIPSSSRDDVPSTVLMAAGPLPRIGADASRLYDTESGQTFVPRGANYVRVSPTVGGRTFHSTFEPGIYDGAAAGEALRGLARDGYNVVRVYIDPGTTDGQNPHGIARGRGTTGYVYDPYMDNFADFVMRATERGVYVLPSMDAFPQNDHYLTIAQNPPGGPHLGIAGDNMWYLHRGFVAAKAEYMRRFAEELEQRVGSSRMTTIFAYSSNNEVAFDGNRPPYDVRSGTFTAINGQSYDMAIPERRQQSADASLAEYSRRLKASLVSADPDALLTMGFYTNRAVGKPGFNGFQQPATTTNTRFPGRPAALSQFGAVDFIDMHVYPHSLTYDLAADLRSSESHLFAKPFIIGEMGARRDIYQNNIRLAAFAMRDMQIASCRLGAKGWIFWTWDTNIPLANLDKHYNLVESRGAINGQLAPIARPNPCA